jgi:hypothetical protein
MSQNKMLTSCRCQSHAPSGTDEFRPALLGHEQALGVPMPGPGGGNVCRMHGARAGAPKGEANGAWRHGMATNEAIAERKAFAELIRRSRRSLATDL